MDREASGLAAKYRAVREQQRRHASAMANLRMSLAVGTVRDADRAAALAMVRRWCGWFADQVAALPPEEQACERQVLALVDAVLGDTAALRR